MSPVDFELHEVLVQTVPVELDAIVRDEVSAASLVTLCLLLDELNKTLKAVARALDIFHSFSVFVQSCGDEGLDRCFLKLAIFILHEHYTLSIMMIRQEF